MITKSIKKITFVSVSNVFNAIIGFAFLTSTAKILTLEDFGKYSLLTALLISISRFMDFGTNSTFVTQIIERPNDEKKLTNAFISLRFLLFLLAIPLTVVLLNIFNLLSLNILIIFLVGLFGYLINFTFYSIFQKDEKFVHLTFLNLIPALIKGFFAFLLFFNLINLTLESAFLIFCGSILSGLIFTGFINREIFQLNFNFLNIRQIFLDASPAGLSQIIYEGWPSINNAIAKFSRGFTDVGVFSIASKMSAIFSLLSFSIFTVLLPKNANLKKKNRNYDFNETVLISVLILVLAVFAIFAGQIFINVFLGEKFKASILLLDILIFASAFTAIHTFIENYFFIEKKTNLILGINITKLVIFLVSSVYLTKQYDLTGLAYSNLISAITAVILTFLLISKSEKKFTE